MDGRELYRVAQQFAQRQFSRRIALRASGLGVAGIVVRRVGIVAPSDESGHRLPQTTGTPPAQSTPGTCPAGSTTEIFLDGAWLCRQSYALCTKAACEPSSDDASIAMCRCFVEDGYSMGYTSCQERKPAGTTLVSTFSTQNVTSQFHVMFCPEQDRWANCLDVPCQIDPANPAEAVCPCPIVASGPSFTFGGDCDTSTCSSVIWSAAAPPGVTQYTSAMACVDQPVTFPTTCPGAQPVASPATTPVA